MKRRDFFRTTAGLGAAAVLTRFSHAVAPSERIRLGFIGVGAQGMSNLKGFVKTSQVVAVCDVDATRLASAKEFVKTQGGECDAVGDYRAILDRKDIDAVVVCTPDHWHALSTVQACMAGKDVYCEKPLSLTIREGQTMVAAARKYDRVVQTGSQQRSDDRFRKACELVRNGKLGKIKIIKVGIPGVNFKGPPQPDGPVPSELNYDMWIGPAPMRPYNAKRVHYNFRFFWDFSGGQTTNFGAHHLDITQWALGMDESGPVEISGKGTYSEDGTFEVAKTSEMTFRYADGTKVVCGQAHPGGVTFETEKGSVHVTRGKLEGKPADLVKAELSDADTKLYVSKDHHGNFLECIKTRKKPICDVGIGHRSATVCHLGNIAVRTGRTIKWDPKKEEIVGDASANAMLVRAYRSPWELPKIA